MGLVNAKFDSKNPFKGQPSPELDHAWHSLFVNSNVRVTSQDLKKINRTSVPLGDGNGFYAIPGLCTILPIAIPVEQSFELIPTQMFITSYTA